MSTFASREDSQLLGHPWDYSTGEPWKPVIEIRPRSETLPLLLIVIELAFFERRMTIKPRMLENLVRNWIMLTLEGHEDNV